MTDIDKPLILVTNDDGIDAPGIRFLTAVASNYGKVIVVAPLTGMSGMGHAITIKTPLRFRRISPNGKQMEYVVDGTPVDCVKLALRKILPRKPDIILSGINHGSNASVNVIYSGTMAAAFEGAMAGIPSVGFSSMDYNTNAPLKHLKPFIDLIISQTIENGLPKNVCLNVNIPITENEKPPKGIKLCRQALGFWQEDFEERVDPHAQPYFWMRGDFINQDDGYDTDLYALDNNWISLVPVHFDFTAKQAFDELRKWNNILSDKINIDQK